MDSGFLYRKSNRLNRLKAHVLQAILWGFGVFDIGIIDFVNIRQVVQAILRIHWSPTANRLDDSLADEIV